MESESDTKKDEQDTSTKSTYFIAVHVGAGYHSPLRSQSYMTAMKDACNAAALILAKNGSALDAVVAALISLEDSPITNAGKGSNLTEDGRVECDASVMESQRGAEGNNGAFAAVGAVRGVKNPILLASSLLQEEKKGRLPLGRIRPIFLVGEGAREWAIEHDVPVVSEEQMLTEDSRKIWKEHRKKVDDEGIVKKRDREDRVENRENKVSRNEFYDIFDTVGAICMDCNGHVATGVSSGGVSLKHKGRVSEAAHYGSGCFVYEDGESVKPTAACTTSGAGEQVMKAMLAYECVKQLVAQENADDAIKYTLESHFFRVEWTI